MSHESRAKMVPDSSGKESCKGGKESKVKVTHRGVRNLAVRNGSPKFITSSHTIAAKVLFVVEGTRGYPEPINCKGISKTESYANHIFGLTGGGWGSFGRNQDFQASPSGCESYVGSGVSALNPRLVELKGQGRAHQMVDIELAVLGFQFLLGGHLIISKGCTVQNVRKLCLYPRPPTWSHRRSGSTQSKKRKGDGVFTLDCPSQQEIVWCFLLSREVHVIHDPEHLVVISGIKSSGKNYDVGTKRTKERRRKTTQAGIYGASALVGIRRVTSSSPCLILVTRVERSLLKSTSGSIKFISILDRMGMKLQSKPGG
eukprot:1152726-Pelagomonas_calceolata.AAC.2